MNSFCLLKKRTRYVVTISSLFLANPQPTCYMCPHFTDLSFRNNGTPYFQLENQSRVVIRCLRLEISPRWGSKAHNRRKSNIPNTLSRSHYYVIPHFRGLAALHARQDSEPAPNQLCSYCLVFRIIKLLVVFEPHLLTF